MKILVTVSILAIGLAVVAYNERQQRFLLSQQVDQYDSQISQLLTQIETRSVQGIQTDRQLQSLRRELNSRDGEITALTRQLELAQNQIDPDYQQLETQIRERLRREVQANTANANADPRVSLVKQLAVLDPMVMAEVMSLNGQYGEFLRTLDVSDERMEVVINALSNMIAEQNQARMDVIQQMQVNADPADAEALQREMQALHNPENQLDILSYDLTEAELNAFSAFQEQRTSYNPFFTTATSTSSGTTYTTIGGAPNGPGILRSGVIRGGSGQSGAIQLLPAIPMPLN